jgi:hypothetical protein
VFNFHNYYVEDAIFGRVLGDLAWGHWWPPEGSPIAIQDEHGGVLDDRLGYSMPLGEYRSGYFRSTFYGLHGEHSTSGDWADYGHPGLMAFMRPEALEWICCNYKDEYGHPIPDPADYRWCDGSPLDPGDGASCDIFFHLDEDCVATPAGNAHLVDWRALEGITCE